MQKKASDICQQMLLVDHSIVRATPLGTGFVDIFIGEIHSESDDRIQ